MNKIVNDPLLKYSEPFVSRHPHDVKGIKAGAGRLQEFKNTEFVRELRKMGFCETGCKQSCLLMRASISRASIVAYKEPFSRTS